MRSGLAAAAALFLTSFLSVDAAQALGRVLAPADHELGNPVLRIAVARSSEQTTVWWSLRLAGRPGRMALLVPALPGSAVDPASRIWFDALERATAPRVVLSDGTPPRCFGGGGSSVHDTTAEIGGGELPVSELAVLSSLETVSAFAKDRGLAFGVADRQALAAYAASHRFLGLVYEVPAQPVWTETLRLSVRRSEPALGLELLDRGAGVWATLWTLAAGRGVLAPGETLDANGLGAVWNLASGDTDYVTRRTDALGSRQQTTWIVEASSDRRSFDWHAIPEGGASIPPLMNVYFDGASGGDECTARAFEVKNAAPVAAACAPGRLALVSGAAPCENPALAAKTDPALLTCGPLDDAALAFAGLVPDQAWLTRYTGRFLEPSPQLVAIDGGDAERVSPVIEASAVDVSGCNATGGASGAGGIGGSFGAGGTFGAGGSGGASGWGGPGGHGGTPGAGGSRVRPREPESVVVVHSGTDVGCTSSGGDADCTGDSSSSDGSSDESCSSDDTSDDSDSEGCGCDSESDDAEGDDCSGDSSSDGGDDCSGDSSGGGEDCSGDSGGDSCSGDAGGDCGGGEVAAIPAAGSATRACPLSRRKAFRPRLSAAVLLLAGVALCTRRRGRPVRPL